MRHPVSPKPFKFFYFLLIFISSSLLIGCEPFKSPEFIGLNDWKLEPKSFFESKLAVKVKLFNPNKHKIVVKRMEADILVNGLNLSSYKLDSTFEVPGNAEFIFPVELKLNNSYLLSGLSGLTSGKEIPYQFKGKIRGMYRSITAEVPFVYSGSLSDKELKF